MCKEAMEERIKNEYELFYLTLRCTSIDQVFSRAREISLKKLIKQALLSMEMEEGERLLWPSDNIIDYLYGQIYENRSPSEDEAWIKREIGKVLEKNSAENPVVC